MLSHERKVRIKDDERISYFTLTETHRERLISYNSNSLKKIKIHINCNFPPTMASLRYLTEIVRLSQGRRGRDGLILSY